MKKLLSILLIIMLLSLNGIVAFADENAGRETKTIDDYISLYEIAGSDVSVIEKETNHATINTSYIGEDYVIEALIDIRIKDNGDRELTITEGDITDVLLFTASGETYLNGKIVLVETTMIQQGATIAPIIPGYETRGQRSVTWQLEVPYGSVVDYSVLDISYVNNFEFEEAVGEVAVNTLVAILVENTIQTDAPLDSFVKQYALTPFVREGIDYMATYFPTRKVMSVKHFKYLHEDGAYVNGKYISRHHWQSYSQQNAPASALMVVSQRTYCVIQTD